MNKVLPLILIITLGLTIRMQAQSYNMSNSRITTCSGSFYDNGGPTGNYSNNQFLVFTACTGQPLSQMQVNFSSFNLEAGNDYLYIYDGSNTFSPLLGVFTGSTNPGIFTSSNGCLTFVFVSNGSVNAAGWATTLSCVSSAPPPCSVSGCPQGGSPPLNDACSNATNLGAIPAPANCPNGMGTVIGVAGTTSCANPENPFLQQQGCLTGNNMPAPAADVWYTFSITGSVLNVQIQGMTTPAAALWQGTNCGNLIGRGCAVGANGSLNETFQALTPGQYFLQISGGSPSDQCNFTLLLKNDRDCNACNTSSVVMANPPPVNGTYQPGQTVTFCYTVSSFNQTSANWLHGVVPQFGLGWDMSTLTNLWPANSCSGQGFWAWYNSPVTSSATGTVAGPGFFYENWQGSPSGVIDNNPGNNYGDHNMSGTCSWTFCWTITTKSGANCIQNSDLTVDVISYGDGETGSWSSLACTTDPPATAIASLECCSTPTLTFTSPTCSGGPSNGTATGTGQGSGPWTYSWYINNILFQSANNQTGPTTINGLIPGSYTFTTTDVNGCSSSGYFIISAPTSLNLSITNANASCGTNNGTAAANVTGGTAPISFFWSNSATTSTVNNLGPGIITVTATDANGCAVTASTNITQPAAPVLNVSSTNVNCHGGNNGSATVTPVGGAAPFQYLWSNSPTTATINNLSANTYTVTVTDFNGCVVSASTVVNQPLSEINASVSSLSLAACDSATGSASVSVTGGTQPYYYSWSNGNTTATATGLTSGNISVTVTDIVGCSVTATGTIVQASSPLTTITSFTEPACAGENTGSAAVSVSGGTQPYTYNWSSGATGATANNLSSGVHAVTVTDSYGCSSVSSITLNEPLPLSVSIMNPVNVSCFGGNDGSATVIATGGNGSYSFAWSNGETTSSISNLISDIYNVVVTDANGCSAASSINISQPDEISIVTYSNDVSCFGGNDGSASVAVAGGTEPYQYSWSSGSSSDTALGLNANNYSVTITDFNGCFTNAAVAIMEPGQLNTSLTATMTNCTANNGTATALVTGGVGGYSYLWSTGATTATATGLQAGNISVQVIDSNGCTTSAGSVIMVSSDLSLNISSITDVLCNGGNSGEIKVTPSGGTAPFNYDWYPAVSNNDLASSLYSGTYMVTVTDDNGCTAIQTILINEPSPLAITSTTIDATCGNDNGSANVAITGGIGPYIYSWNTGDNTAIVNNLSSGISTVTITDGNGCSKMEIITINNIAGPVLSLGNIQDITCFGANDGEVHLNTTGGTGTISYNWTGNVSNTATAAQLTPGAYTVIATDANGCTSMTDFTITEPDELILNLTATDVSCSGEDDGSASATTTGGTGNYSYFWQGFAGNTSQISSLASGNYSVIITDQNGCSISGSVNITEPSPVTLTTSGDANICLGQSTILTATGSGGSGQINYIWSTGDTNSFLTVTPGTNQSYSVIAVDENGCQSLPQTIEISHFPALNISLPAVSTLCAGQNINLSPFVTGGDGGPYYYEWNSGQNTHSINVAPIANSTYFVTVTDGCGISGTTSVTVPVEPLPLIAFSSDKTEGCGGVTVQFNNQSVVPTGSSFHWDFGDNSFSSSYNPVNNYSQTGSFDVTLKITTSLGCVSSFTYPEMIKVYPVPVSSFTYSPHNELSVHNSTVSFLDLSRDADFWKWDFGDGKGTSVDQNPQYLYPGYGTFLVSLIVSNQEGCSDTSKQKIKIEDNFAVFFPNSFTPNGDGSNDYFYAYGEGINLFNMKIFDRWGKVVFESNSSKLPWNGRYHNSSDACPSGVYLYSVLVTDTGGKTHSYKGTLNLLR